MAILQQPVYFKRQEGIFPAFIVIARLPLNLLLLQSHSYLCPQEKFYFNSLRAPKRQHSYLLGRYVAKKAISALTGTTNLSAIRIGAGVFQQPVVKQAFENKFQVSITHSGVWGACVAFPEEHPVAIDVEEIRPDRKINTLIQLTRLEETVFVKLSFSEDEKMTLCWTIKEALSKVLKTGLTTSFEIYEIATIKTEDKYLISTFTHFNQYKVISWVSDNYAWSIALPLKSDYDVNALLEEQLKCRETASILQ